MLALDLALVLAAIVLRSALPIVPAAAATRLGRGLRCLQGLRDAVDKPDPLRDQQTR